MNDLKSFLGSDYIWRIRYIYIQDAEHTESGFQYVYFLPSR